MIDQVRWNSVCDSANRKRYLVERLAVAGVALACVTLAACGFPALPALDGDANKSDAPKDGTTDSETFLDAPADGSGALGFVATWMFVKVNGQAQGCPSSFPVTVIHAQQFDPTTLQDIGTPITASYQCAAQGGSVSVPMAGSYRVSMTSTDASQSSTYATSLPVNTVVSTTNMPTIPFKIYVDGGYFKVAWKLIGQVTSHVLTCAQAGTPTFEVISTPTGSTNASVDDFNCSDGSGITTVLLAGGYTESLSVNDASMNAVASQAVANQMLPALNGILDLGTITLAIPGK